MKILFFLLIPVLSFSQMMDVQFCESQISERELIITSNKALIDANLSNISYRKTRIDSFFQDITNFIDAQYQLGMALNLNKSNRIACSDFPTILKLDLQRIVLFAKIKSLENTKTYTYCNIKVMQDKNLKDVEDNLIYKKYIDEAEYSVTRLKAILESSKKQIAKMNIDIESTQKLIDKINSLIIVQ